MKRPLKVLQVAAVDVTVSKLLLPLIRRLQQQGYQVHIACSDGPYARDLKAQGYAVTTIPIRRGISPLSHLRSVWGLYRLMKRERFDIVHMHTPVAAALGRLAAWAAGAPAIVYTAHGFYFHDRMNRHVRWIVLWVEKLLGRITDLLFCQSAEDTATALREGIGPRERVMWIGNGVDLRRFGCNGASDGTRQGLGLGPRDRIVGFVGRLVREKGVMELVQAMRIVVKAVPQARLLVVGDTLDSDRDRGAGSALRRAIESNGLAGRVVFAGHVEDMPRVMSAMDVFVLPSYREGMPRTIIEAMAAGKPVVATNIRGCREEVVPGVSGLLVPVGDAESLGAAIRQVLADPELAHRMGAAGQLRASEFFDEEDVLARQVEAYKELVRNRLVPQARRGAFRLAWGLAAKRLLDIMLSLVGLILLAFPFLIIALLIKGDSRGPVFFRQERAGLKGKPFRVWKFRTMEEGAIHKGLGYNVAREDTRLTRVGRRLRDWGLDELPQLINVLKGEMSIVGPRPTLLYQVELYDDFQRCRLEAKPGITSLAVVRGRNLLSWQRRIRLDVRYVERWSLGLDLWIMLRTLWVVLVTRRGIYGPKGINDDFVSTPIRPHPGTGS